MLDEPVINATPDTAKEVAERTDVVSNFKMQYSEGSKPQSHHTPY